jgi:hypothetical protein
VKTMALDRLPAEQRVRRRTIAAAEHLTALDAGARDPQDLTQLRQGPVIAAYGER